MNIAIIGFSAVGSSLDKLFGNTDHIVTVVANSQSVEINADDVGIADILASSRQRARTEIRSTHLSIQRLHQRFNGPRRAVQLS